MPEYDTATGLDTTDFNNDFDGFSVENETLDSDAYAQNNEYYYQNTDFEEQLGYYRNTPDLRLAFKTLAKWTVGKGFQADEFTQFVCDNIRGNGKSSFNQILFNQFVFARVCGDSFAHIIKNEDGMLINLKPLNPGKMRVVASMDGMIKRYELMDAKNKQVIKKFDPEEIFHLMNDPECDEIHGRSEIPHLKKAINAIEEANDDWRKVLHRNIYPIRILEYADDDPTEKARLKSEYKDALEKGEAILIPKGTVELKSDTVPPNSTIQAQPWIEMKTEDFYKNMAIPMMIIGAGKQLTDTAGKMKYLAWQQTVEYWQKQTEEQVGMQLGLIINLEFPADLMDGFISSKQEGQEGQEGVTPPNMEPQRPAAEPNDGTAEMEGKT